MSKIISCKGNMKQILNSCLKINQSVKFTSLKTLFFSHKFLKHNFFKQAIFTQNCILCASHFNSNSSTISSNNFTPNHYAMCHACMVNLPWQNANHCPQCGLASDGNLCGSCINSTPHFDATHAVFSYEFPVDKMMQRYKYGNMLSLSTLFGHLLNDKIKQENIDLSSPCPCIHSA